MDAERASEACKAGELMAGLLEQWSPVSARYDSVAEAAQALLPDGLRAHCWIAGVTNGCLKVVADGSSYMFELRLCKAVLLRELQRMCPAARVRRIEVGMGR
ncbi:MAG: DUF721 domain-containing protein [Planctomycetes bacterium]|jgi:hypothetical protein|nr:DUF721 domain-containing protein [Planctomycetota bacterium]